MFWLDRQPLAIGGEIVARIGTAASPAVVSTIEKAIDPGLLASDGADVIEQNHVGEIGIELRQPLATDTHAADPNSGRVVLEFGGRIAGGGLVLATDTGVPPDRRARYEADTGRTDAQALQAKASVLAPMLAALSPAERIARLRRDIAGKIVFTTSFGLEDQVILHLVSQQQDDGIDIVTLDTGRLFPETYALWARAERRYGRTIRAVYPRHDDLEALVARQGIDGFYRSREARVACCNVRKVEPLERALAGARGWIAGLRAEQSAHRRDMALVAAEPGRALIKLHPLFDWTREQLMAFVSANDVPVNPLHARGFASIGCAPCTRAIAPGEPERAGRWWWEEEEKKECGLHARSS